MAAGETGGAGDQHLHRSRHHRHGRAEQPQKAESRERALDGARESDRADRLVQRDRQDELAVHGHDAESVGGERVANRTLRDDAVGLGPPAERVGDPARAALDRGRAGERGKIDDDPPAADAAELRDAARPVRHVHDHAQADHRVDAAVRERQRVRVARRETPRARRLPPRVPRATSSISSDASTPHTTAPAPRECDGGAAGAGADVERRGSPCERRERSSGAGAPGPRAGAARWGRRTGARRNLRPRAGRRSGRSCSDPGRPRARPPALTRRLRPPPPARAVQRAAQARRSSLPCRPRRCTSSRPAPGRVPRRPARRRDRAAPREWRRRTAPASASARNAVSSLSTWVWVRRRVATIGRPGPQVLIDLQRRVRARSIAARPARSRRRDTRGRPRPAAGR